MMHERISIEDAFNDAQSALQKIQRAHDARSLLMSHRRAAICSDGAVTRWHAIRVASGLGVCAVLDEDGEQLRDDAGRLVTTNDNRESLVVDSLIAAGLDAYCPRDWRTKRSPRKKSGVKFSVPMFPTYAFVRLPQSPSAMLGVLSFEGVRGFVSNASGPVLVPNRLVDEIKVYEGLSPKQRRLICSVANVGDRMIITRNVFAGHKGEVVYVDGNRGMIDLELSLFGRATRVTLGLDDVKKLG